jgi:regulatory protein
LFRDEALKKLQHYCAYQDRCHQEVRKKAISIGVYGDELEEIISELIKEKFLDEERYARSYARGKFYQKKWGRNKIKQELKFRNISGYCIRKAMEEIQEDEYAETLQSIYLKKLQQYTSLPDFEKNNKALQYCISRGYEPELVFVVLNQQKKS